ncbi:DUF29 domain-containing protein [Candidatus Electronema sp. PJ]|uniref:DUF29 domain-containing protein n=1 Tax=Candidatus Electronema sp. PJ TaxID=3401572 RepID=UPI003AA8162D
MTTASLYETDMYAWAMRNAQLLRERCTDQLDFEHLAEEIESVGASEKRELQSRLEVLIAHLLKLNYLHVLLAQNERGWKLTVREQRRRIAECLSDSPSLQAHLPTCSERAYSYAVDSIVRQIGVDESILPATCPYTLEQILDSTFYP